MRHSFIGAFCCFLLLGAAGQAWAHTNVQVPIDDPWHVVKSKFDGDRASLIEWAPGNQTVENWKELVSLGTFVTTKPAELLARAVKIAERSVAKFKVLRQTPDEVLLEVATPVGQHGEPAEYGLRRLFLNAEGMYYIEYASKVPLSPPVKAKWVKFLTETKAVASGADGNSPYDRVVNAP